MMRSMHLLKYISLIAVLGVLIFIIDTHTGVKKISHNCRLWGIVCTASNDTIEFIISTHLDSLQNLGCYNPDGWGMGYYVQPETTAYLPVLTRGEPEAQLDPRYAQSIANMTRHMKKCAIAHIRRGSSGPTGGIPDPHPFYRTSTHWDFAMFFAHNGKLPTQTLFDLITKLDPDYLSLNPPDYNPNYLDSDLYAIYIMEVIDAFPDSTIEACIAYAVLSIDSACGPLPGEFNFVMTDGTSLWALCYTRNSTTGYGMYFYPHPGVSNYWIAASEPLDSLAGEWTRVPESILVTLTPGELPVSINVFDRFDELPVIPSSSLDIIYPNPSLTAIHIRFSVNSPYEHNDYISIRIYDITGRLVREFFFPYHAPGTQGSVLWDRTDACGDDVPAGTYVCHLTGRRIYDVKKIILLK
jgi:predicted glutamine amidotransferase